MRKPRLSEISNLPKVICLISGRARVKTRQPVIRVWTLGTLYCPAFYHGAGAGGRWSLGLARRGTVFMLPSSEIIWCF